ncbi:MAG TPA: CBS domain-containing protein [Flavobacterium sp.]|nr:CBS domain-containing protein [Flavobacterium sp.]
MQKTLSDIQNDLKMPDLKTHLKEAKSMIRKHKWSYLPIVNENHFVGNFAAEDIHCLDDKDLIENHLEIFNPFYLNENFSLLEAIEIMLKNESDICAIIDQNRHYLGYTTRDAVLEQLTEMPFVREEGTMLIIEKNMHDYSFSQIAQIVESNGGKLLGIVATQISGNNIQFTLKIIGLQINEIIQSFRRYNYEVISEHREDKFLNELKDRSEYLDKYLNI